MWSRRSNLLDPVATATTEQIHAPVSPDDAAGEGISEDGLKREKRHSDAFTEGEERTGAS